jgi:hypothetical protein
MIFRKSTFAATAMALLLAACAQVGNRFNQDAVSQLRPGISTEQEAIALLGQPVTWVAMPDGGKAVKWMYAYGTALATGGGAAAGYFRGRRPGSRRTSSAQRRAGARRSTVWPLSASRSPSCRTTRRLP